MALSYYTSFRHIIAAVAGITSDANSLTKTLRQTCQQYRVTFQDGIPVEHLVQKVCNLKQRYTHFGGRAAKNFTFQNPP